MWGYCECGEKSSFVIAGVAADVLWPQLTATTSFYYRGPMSRHPSLETGVPDNLFKTARLIVGFHNEPSLRSPQEADVATAG